MSLQRAWEALNPNSQGASRPQLEADGEVSGLTILIADDEAAILNLAGRALRSSGYTVLEAADGLVNMGRPTLVRSVAGYAAD